MRNRSSVLTVLVMGSLLELGQLSPAAAQTANGAAGSSETTSSVKAPDTPEEHQALADGYRKKAAAYREDAVTHRQMLDKYKQQMATPVDAKAGRENPWIKKMRVHCEQYIRDAEKLATDAEKFAEYHGMRAAELQGR